MSRDRDSGQWWSEAWSPVTGCTSAGAGCDHCWARAMVRRFPTLHGCDATVDHPKHGKIGAAPTPFSTVRCHPDRLDKPLHWRKPRVVLVSMLGDLFHADVPDEFVRDVFEIMRRTPQHHYCVLTKRPQRAVLGRVRAANEWAAASMKCAPPRHWPHVLLMASVWDQASADAACAAFSTLPAGVRWGLHCEPMLGPVDAMRALSAAGVTNLRKVAPTWIVCGGENGPGARPMDLHWALDLRAQCRAAGVPFWFKGGSKFSPEMSNEERSGLESSRETPLLAQQAEAESWSPCAPTERRGCRWIPT